MLEDISVEFPQDPLTKEKIRKWLDDIGLVGKLKGYENPITLFGLVGDNPDTFLRALPAEEGGLVLWAHLRGVDKQRAQDKLSLAQQPGKIRCDSIASLPGSKASSSRKRRWDELNVVLSEVVRKTKKIDKTSTPYSSIEWSNVEDIFAVNPWKIDPKVIEEDVVNKLHLQLLDCGEVFGTISSGKESKRLHFIAPILVTVALLFKDEEEKVKILVEEDVDGVNIRTNGHFEFVLQKGTRRVCIVEAKKEEMEKGMAQSLLGCEAIADVENTSVVFAVVTNFLQWYFLKDTDDHIFRNATTLTTIDDTPSKESIARIAGMLYTLLTDA